MHAEYLYFYFAKIFLNIVDPAYGHLVPQRLWNPHVFQVLKKWQNVDFIVLSCNHGELNEAV